MSLAKLSGWMPVFLCVFIVACGSAGRSYVSSGMQETLEIEILPNDSKMFVYRLRSGEDQMPRVHIDHGEGGHHRESGGVDVGHSSTQRMQENAAYVVENMGYCREGFLPIDSSFSRFNLWVKGECKESATADDRKKFGEKQILPVQLKR